jgi:hypothetical protein
MSGKRIRPVKKTKAAARNQDARDAAYNAQAIQEAGLDAGIPGGETPRKHKPGRRRKKWRFE